MEQLRDLLPYAIAPALMGVMVYAVDWGLPLGAWPAVVGRDRYWICQLFGDRPPDSAAPALASLEGGVTQNWNDHFRRHFRH